MNLNTHQKGLAAGIFCFAFWGFVPIFYKFINDIPALVTVAHRIIWGSLTLIVFLLIRERSAFFKVMKLTYKQFFGLFFSGLLISGNWLVFIWAVNHNQILATSLGYFINPLVNIFLGVLFLHEKLSRPQQIALIIAILATVFYAFYLGQPPWIALFLAFTFGMYGFVRKKLIIKPLVGLLWETIILALPSLIYLLGFAPDLIASAQTSSNYLLLFASGVITIIPLIAFNYAAKILPYSLIGFIQYLGPSISFLSAILLYNEVFTFGHKIAFGGIWLALIIVSWSPFMKLLKK